MMEKTDDAIAEVMVNMNGSEDLTWVLGREAQLSMAFLYLRNSIRPLNRIGIDAEHITCQVKESRN